MHLRRTIWLAVLAAAAVSFPIVANADPCGPGPNAATNCFFSTDVVNVDYGTLTLLAPNGSFLSTTNIVTAETGLTIFDTTPPGVPAAYVASLSTLIGQLQADPQSTFAGFPSWLFTGLTNLEDANGFGLVTDPSAVLNGPSDPIAIAFNADLAAVGGQYTTISDTGFQTQPFSQAACDYDNSVIAGACTGPPPPGTSQYSFTYQLGPETIDGNVYTSLVNFEIFSRNVTEQLVATPEPVTVAPLGILFVVLGILKRSKAA